jgi:hypothetical protein
LWDIYWFRVFAVRRGDNKKRPLRQGIWPQATVFPTTRCLTQLIK